MHWLLSPTRFDGELQPEVVEVDMEGTVDVVEPESEDRVELWPSFLFLRLLKNGS